MSGLLSEKDMEARLGEYEEREERRGCCQDIDAVMDRYILYVGVIFTIGLGPFSGMLLVAATQETGLYVSAVPSLVFFLCSLLMSVSRTRERRSVSRLWLGLGLVWFLCGWVVWYRKDFTESPLEWQIVALVQTLVFLLGVPIFITDPLIG